MRLREVKDEIARRHGFSSWQDVIINGGTAHFINFVNYVAELYVKSSYDFLLGKMIRYRYIDWEEGSFTPWATCTEKDIEKLEDKSIDIIQFKP